jgi:hypothetical protein
VSTNLYLVCMSHEPPLKSDHSSGQHLSDLDQIREDLAKRDVYAQLDWEIVWGVSGDRRNTVAFAKEHPRCEIAIRDEYGYWHPLTETAQGECHNDGLVSLTWDQAEGSEHGGSWHCSVCDTVVEPQED